MSYCSSRALGQAHKSCMIARGYGCSFSCVGCGGFCEVGYSVAAGCSGGVDVSWWRGDGEGHQQRRGEGLQIEGSSAYTLRVRALRCG